MADTGSRLSAADADQLRAFERQRHDSLASTYRDFFTPITALAIPALLAAAGTGPTSRLLDVATGPGSVAAKARRLGARTTGVDLSPGMIALATASHPGIDFRVGDVEHLPFAVWQRPYFVGRLCPWCCRRSGHPPASSTRRVPRFCALAPGRRFPVGVLAFVRPPLGK